jgi:pyruvate dehydrogenase E2 component (dihydrolipoamide acetyltransferase)
VTETAVATVEIRMPKLSDSMEEATILAWLRREGDAFKRGEPLVEVDTDKATVVYEAESDGVLVEILVPEGGSARLGDPIARASAAGGVVQPAPSRPATATRSGRARATPVARKRAAELGVDLSALAGTGPGGRIRSKDVQAGRPSPAPPSPGRVQGRRVELSPAQRTIARRMAESRTTIPDFTLRAEIDLTRALELQRELNDLRPEARVSVNDLIVKSTALALRAHPRLNASFDGDAVVEHDHVHVGIAVATDDALLVPVIRGADALSLVEVAAESKRLAERARARAVTPEELDGGTFTISNLGMFGITSFEAVINPPQAAILAVGAVERRPVFDEGDRVVARSIGVVTLSCDHRVVYGADAARFLQTLQGLVERPLQLFLEARDG